MGNEIGVNTYFIKMQSEITGMKFIEPEEEYLSDTGKEGDNNGTFPLYVYNYGLDCKDIYYTLFVH